MTDVEEVGDDNLDNLLDSALEDFKKVDLSQTKEKCDRLQKEQSTILTASGSSELSLGKGLGCELPPIPRGKLKSKGKDSVLPKDAAPGEADSSMAATLQKLAEQTRQTVQTMNEDMMGDEIMENVVKQFEELGGSQDMQSVMDVMMKQLLSKEILHEPMKEIGGKYPQWLQENKSKLSGEDFDRYSKQHRFIMQLCDVYEKTPDDFQKIVELMQEVQNCGHPPPDIVQELAPGLELGEDELPMIPDLAGGPQGNCSIM